MATVHKDIHEENEQIIAVKKIVREFKNKTGYDEKVATIRKNTSDLISEYKDSINYDENVSKIRRECDEKIKEAKAKAQISFRLNQNEMDQRKVKNSYEMAKLGFTIVGGDNEFGKAAVEKAEKQRDEEIKRLKKEHSDIEGEAKSIRERYEAEREEKLAALKFDLDKREESYKSMERTDLDLLDKQVREETKSAREFVESIRPEDDTSVLEDYDRKYMRYCTLRNNENYSVQSVVNSMDANDRAACYLAQNGWTKASVQIVLFGGIAAVCCAVAGPVFKGIKTIIDISNRMSKFA